jgi:hypothetical protein
MATGIAFSPKEYTLWIANEATAGTSALHASNMYQLDVDSVGFPSLNLNQKMDVRTGLGRTLKDEDFFQDNKLRVTELSISGTLHNDAGHLALLRNVCTSNSGNITVASGYQPPSVKYGSSNTTSGDTFTIVMKSVDPTVGAGVALDDNRNFVLAGCVCTNFAITADTGTDGGQYKFSATIQTGYLPNLNDTTARNAIGSNVYAVDTFASLSTSSGHEVLNTSVVMGSFTCTIDNPAVFVGATANGFDVVNRGSEISVTVDTQVKLDDETKTLVSAFDTQTAFNGTDTFVIVNDDKFGIDIDDGIVTNAALSEGDIMMLDLSLKAVDAGAALVTIDVA